MIDRKLMLRLFRALSAELRRQGVRGEALLCGGAVMCLVFKARKATKDIDAVFAPAREMRKAVRAVGERFGLPGDWLDDAAKGYFESDPPREEVLDLPHLRVYAPRADYLLAMKCVAARFDSHDKDDALFLIRRLGLASPEQVFAVVENYYPRRLVPPKTRFLVEELFEGRS